MKLSDIQTSRASYNRKDGSIHPDAHKLAAFIADSGKKHQGNKSRLGRTLEKLVADSTRGVHLVQIGRVARTLPGGKVVAKKGPVDFMGCFTSGRALVFDCKSTKEPNRLPLSAAILKPHQRKQLVAFGEVGAASGILAESVTAGRLYWIGWQLLINPRPSIPWEECVDIGTSAVPVDWEAVRRAAGVSGFG